MARPGPLRAEPGRWLGRLGPGHFRRARDRAPLDLLDKTFAFAMILEWLFGELPDTGGDEQGRGLADLRRDPPPTRYHPPRTSAAPRRIIDRQ